MAPFATSYDAIFPAGSGGRFGGFNEVGGESALGILASMPFCTLLSWIERPPHGHETLNTLSPGSRDVFGEFTDVGGGRGDKACRPTMASARLRSISTCRRSLRPGEYAVLVWLARSGLRGLRVVDFAGNI